jgi:hypothetical protein
VPYTAGGRSPTRGYLPLALPITAFAFFPGLWLYGTLYAYPYHYPYYYDNDGRNQTANATCLCQQYSECGCDDTGNSTFLQNLINNGTDHPVNTSTSHIRTAHRRHISMEHCRMGRRLLVGRIPAMQTRSPALQGYSCNTADIGRWRPRLEPQFCCYDHRVHTTVHARSYLLAYIFCLFEAISGRVQGVDGVGGKGPSP